MRDTTEKVCEQCGDTFRPWRYQVRPTRFCSLACYRAREAAKAKGRGPVYEARQAMGLSQKEFARLLGCALITIKKHEQGGTFFGESCSGPRIRRRFNRIVPAAHRRTSSHPQRKSSGASRAPFGAE